jgi:2-polyprenyl-3-methyl-5-hydroxy-6-metoxy-1,4-benzoquinol methylase
MRYELLEKLRCPKTGQCLTLDTPETIADAIENGWLVSVDGQHRYSIRNGIPRFVPEVNYADNFGMQWNHFRQTQLDSHSGHPISANRFWLATGWRPEDMKDQWVLDAGCGAGRFAEVALNAGANVVALDYSSAVDACYANLKHHPNLHVVQGDIYALPFPKEFFPFVYSLGVLQHTPYVARAFAALPPMVAGGGKLCVEASYQTYATTKAVQIVGNGSTNPATYKSVLRSHSSIGSIAQTFNPYSRLHRYLSLGCSSTEGMGASGYLRYVGA